MAIQSLPVNAAVQRVHLMEATVLTGMVAASTAAAAVHFVVVPEHLHEWTLFGLFFLGLGGFELAWAVGVMVSPTRVMLGLGLAANLGTIALWAVSRTVGMPIGPMHWTPEVVGLPDLLCVAFEALIVAGCVGLLNAARRRS